MEILETNKRYALLEYLPLIRYTLAEWLFVEIRIDNSFDQAVTISHISELLHGLFKSYDGRIYVCNSREILMLIQWGRKNDPEKVVREVKYHLPAGSCEVKLIPSTANGLTRMELMILPSTASQGNPLYMARTKRRDNVFLVADDDMFMRTTLRGIIAPIGAVFEAATGGEVEKAYQACNPDAVFLDIHLPEKSGTDLLQALLKLDADAYIVMVSSDSSRHNVQDTLRSGAKDFLTKPFTRERVLGCFKQCSTVY